jgi:hypothetical protein
MKSNSRRYSSMVSSGSSSNGNGCIRHHHHGRSKHQAYNSTITMELRCLILLIVAVSSIMTLIFIIYFNSAGMISSQTNDSYSNNMKTKTSWEVTSEQIEQQQPFNENNIATKATKLIIVAGHSVTISGHLQDADHDESDWYLLDYQKHHGLPEAIAKHIEAGIGHAGKDSETLLIFSGGQTRASIGPESEGSSYYRVADVMNMWSQPIARRSKQYFRGNSDSHSNGENLEMKDDPIRTVRARTITEEYATDSFQNLLFSICRFYEITGKYPTEITMISYTFKRHRFESLHVPALRWPLDKFHYIGVDPPTKSGFDITESTRGEIENAAKLFVNDPYGCYSDILQEKRQQRNPFLRTPPYDITCPDMKELLHYCGTTFIAENQVPWS